MGAALEALNVRRTAGGRPRLAMGIGLAHGEVFAGNIGSERRLEFTVIGDAVNQASKLCDLAIPGQLLLTESLRSALRLPAPALRPLEVRVPGLVATGETPAAWAVVPAARRRRRWPPCRAPPALRISRPTDAARRPGRTRTRARERGAPGLRGGARPWGHGGGAARLGTAVRAALDVHGGLYAYGASHPTRRELRGRAPAYAVPLGDATVVVRHSWHGGALAALTRDLFVAPTRAPRELATSERLRSLGVRTPEVVAYVRYPALPGLERADVATRLVEGGRDLAEVIRALPLDRDPPSGWVRATGALLHALAAAGARHPDLNLKNVLLVARPGRARRLRGVGARRRCHAGGTPTRPTAGAPGRSTSATSRGSCDRSRSGDASAPLPVRDVELVALRTISRHGAEAPPST
jgi:hypothetical protein